MRAKFEKQKVQILVYGHIKLGSFPHSKPSSKKVYFSMHFLIFITKVIKYKSLFLCLYIYQIP
jgi:hypothetical protein